MDQKSPPSNGNGNTHNQFTEQGRQKEFELGKQFPESQTEFDNQPGDYPGNRPATRQSSLLEKWLANLRKQPKSKIILWIVVTFIPLTMGYVGYVREILPLIRPVPPMAGEFNIAIAPFTQIDDNGRVSSSVDGEKIANFIYQRLESSLSELDTNTIQVEVREPEDTKEIRGATREDRYDAAEVLAEEINAHIVIYGVIQVGGSPELYPEFFVSYRGYEQGDEIAGAHHLGSPLRIELPFDETKIQDVENPALSARINALSLIVIGLAYDSIDKPEQAIAYYQRADTLPGWLPNAGKEVLYLLMGNAYLRQASTKKDPGFVPLADEAYNRALEIDADYPRALMGKGGVAYLLALGDPKDNSLASIDLSELQESEDYFQDVLNMGELPESMNIPPKVHFNLGQIYLVRGQVQDPQWLEKAQAEFDLVLIEYGTGIERIQEMASQTYARKALINRLQGNHEAALEYYDKAIAIASPFYEAMYKGKKAEVYLVQGQVEQAILLLEEAIRDAEFYSYPQLVTQFTSQINELR